MMSRRQSKQLEAWAARAFAGQFGSQVFVLFWQDAIVSAPEAQAVPVLQLGFAAVLDQAIVVVAENGASVPENLRRLAIAIEYYERGALSSMKAAVLRAMTAVDALEPRPAPVNGGANTNGRAETA